MTNFNIIKLHLVTLAGFLAIDLLWLGFLARNIYRKYLGYLLSSTTNWAAALIFYLIFIAGLLYFVVIPGLQAGSLSKTILQGALLGFLAYATYDLTNLATIKGWPWEITVLDMLWGMFLSAMVCGFSYLAGHRLGM